MTDQAIGLPDLDGFDGRADAGLAALAVVEGDASLLMQRWAMQQLSLMEQLGAASGSLGPADQLQSTPWVLQQQLVSPYTAGLEFACERFLDGGWTAIDTLYAPSKGATTFTGSDQAAAISCDADEVRLGTGPDADTARAATGR